MFPLVFVLLILGVAIAATLLVARDRRTGLYQI